MGNLRYGPMSKNGMPEDPARIKVKGSDLEEC